MKSDRMLHGEDALASLHAIEQDRWHYERSITRLFGALADNPAVKALAIEEVEVISAERESTIAASAHTVARAFFATAAAPLFVRSTAVAIAKMDLPR